MGAQTSTTQISRFCYQCQRCLAAEGETLQDIYGSTIVTVAKLMSCARCHIASYCSKECQKNHWESHKINCIENHTAFFGMDREVLTVTIQKLFKSTNLASSPDLIGMGYGQMMLTLDSRLEFIKADGIYGVESGKIFESFRQLIASEIASAKKKPDLFKERIAYLEQLKRLAKAHLDRYIVTVTIRGTEYVGNFQFRLCSLTSQAAKERKIKSST